MDDFTFSQIPDSQSSMWKYPIMSSTLLDQSMPDLFDITYDVTINQTQIDHEEFVQNEIVIDVVEDMLDKVEHELLDNNNNDENDSGDDEYYGKCNSKRQMNESIMSIDDRMTCDSKKIKNQLNNSIMEFNEEKQELENSLLIGSNNGDLIGQTDDKENLNPKSPSISALINFSITEDSKARSPQRPVLAELKSDLFGIIYPNESNELEDKTTDDLFSMSIFICKEKGEEKPIEDVIEDVSFNASIFNSCFEKEREPQQHLTMTKTIEKDLNENEFKDCGLKDESEIGKISIITESGMVSLKSESISFDNIEKELKMCDQDISFDKENVFHNDQTIPIDEINQPDPIPILNAEIESKLHYESKIVELNEELENLQNQLNVKHQETDQQSPNTSDYQLHNVTAEVNDIVFSMLDRVNTVESELVYEKKISELVEQIEQLKKQINEIQNKANDKLDQTFSYEDRMNLIETKLFYENDIVNMQEKIDKLEEEIERKDSVTNDLIQQKVSNEAEIEDLKESLQLNIDQTKDKFNSEWQKFMETKLNYENEILKLNDRNNVLQQDLLSVKKQFETILTKPTSNVEQQTSFCDEQSMNELSFSFADRMNLIETKLSYENAIVDLREQMDQLKLDLNIKENNLLSYEREHSDLKTRIEQLSVNQLELINENKTLNNTILDMDEQRTKMRQQHEHEISKVNSYIVELQSEKQNMIEEIKEKSSKIENLIQGNANLRKDSDFAFNQLTNVNLELKAIKMLSDQYVDENCDLTQENESLKEKITELQLQIENLQQNSKLVTQNFNSNQVSLSTQLEESRSKLQETIVENDLLKSENIRIKKELESFNVLIDELKQKDYQIRSENEIKLTEVIYERDNLREKLNKINGHNEQLRLELKNSEFKFENLEGVYKKSTIKADSTIFELNEKISKYTKMIEQMEQKSLQLEEKNMSLQESIRIKDKTLVDQKFQIEQSLNGQIKKLESSNIQAEQNLKCLTAELTEANANLQKFADEIASIVAICKSTFEMNNIKFDSTISCSNCVSMLIEYIKQLKQSIYDKENHISIFQLEAKTNEMRIKNSETLVTKLQNMVDELTKQEHELAKEKFSLEKSINDLQSIERNLQSKLSKELVTNESLTSKLEASISDCNTLKSKVIELETEKANFEDRNDVIRERINWLFDYIHKLPIRLKLKNSIVSTEKIMSDIQKVVDRFQEDQTYKDGVQTESVVKILLSINHKLNYFHTENKKVFEVSEVTQSDGKFKSNMMKN
ncbi:coiled-coil domain-containing protein mad1 [Blomia tropicalis]|nr:coiled-coil domain-containing protein mad1 [Blomia tropicalis]